MSIKYELSCVFEKEQNKNTFNEFINCFGFNEFKIPENLKHGDEIIPKDPESGQITFIFGKKVFTADMIDEIMFTPQFEEILKKIIKLKNLKMACALSKEVTENISEALFEYYSDPYYFCFELKARYLFLDELKDEINKIKKVLPKKELTELIKKNARKPILIGKGIGILKTKYGAYEEPVYPRYFIRKELRKRGMQIEEGKAEEYAKRLGLE